MLLTHNDSKRILTMDIDDKLDIFRFPECPGFVVRGYHKNCGGHCHWKVVDTLTKKRKNTDTESMETWQYMPVEMQKHVVVDRLRKNGCRVTRQREILIDIILQGECTSCKEIYILAAKEDPGIGLATVYRMVRALEEIGALQRKNAYRIFDQDYMEVETCLIQLENGEGLELKVHDLKQIVEKGMRVCGRPIDQKVKKVLVKNRISEIVL